MAWLTVEYGTLSRIGLPLPRAGEGGVGVLPQAILVERMDFPPPAALFERVDLPRERER